MNIRYIIYIYIIYYNIHTHIIYIIYIHTLYIYIYLFVYSNSMGHICAAKVSPATIAFVMLA